MLLALFIRINVLILIMSDAFLNLLVKQWSACKWSAPPTSFEHKDVSLNEEALNVIGLHSSSSHRLARPGVGKRQYSGNMTR